MGHESNFGNDNQQLKSRKTSTTCNLPRELLTSQLLGSWTKIESLLGENLSRRSSAVVNLKKLIKHENLYHRGKSCDTQWFYIWMYKSKLMQYSHKNMTEYDIGHRGVGDRQCSWNLMHRETDCVTAQLEYMVTHLAKFLMQCDKIDKSVKQEYNVIFVTSYLNQVNCTSIDIIEKVLQKTFRSKSVIEIEGIMENEIRQILLAEFTTLISIPETTDIDDRIAELDFLFKQEWSSMESLPYQN